MKPKRFIHPPLFLLALAVSTYELKAQTCPVPPIMDGHTHMGFATALSGEVAVESLDYITERGYGAAGFVMPVDRRELTDLPATLTDEVDQLQELSRELKTFALARTPEDVAQACEEGKLAVFLTIETFDGIFGNEPERVDRYAEMGILSITLVNNEFDELLSRHETSAELTPLGRDIITRMNDKGILVDITHLWPQEMLAAVAASNRPVIASHSNPQGAGAPDSPLFDEVVEAMATKGGLIMLSFNASRLFRTDEDQTDAVGRVLDQMDHIRNLVGIDHLGIGTDLQAYGQYVPEELARTSAIAALQARMKERGYSPDDIEKVLGGNFLRLLGEVRTR
jgi:microsomal dipeptidase-like Zn-dependent dipeptidase